MGQYAVVNGTVRVVAAPGFHPTLNPESVDVAQGDLDMVARFRLAINRDPGLEVPAYLLIAGTSIGEFKLNGVPLTVEGKDYALVPVDVNEVDVEFDMTGMDIIDMPFAIGVYQDEPTTPEA